MDKGGERGHVGEGRKQGTGEVRMRPSDRDEERRER